MTYEEFLKFVPTKCMYETIYDDSDGRPILVIRMLDAYGMVNKAQRPWVGLTFDEKNDAIYRKGEWKTSYMEAVIEYIEAKLKEKNA